MTRVTRRLSTIALLLLAGAPLAAQNKSKVLEEIVARVNNDIITLTQVNQAKQTLADELRQDCPQCTPQQLQEKIAERSKDVLRDLIDQSLLVQRAKDAGINVDADVIKRLDQIRQQNNLPSMEALEKAVTGQGINYEDFKNNIKNQLLTQELIRREVGSRIIIDHEQVKKYYEAHKSNFRRPEQVILREIFVSTEGKPASDIPELRKKAEDLLARVKRGDDFAELAKQGGMLGAFERGQLSKQIEDLVFKMNRGDLTDVIETKTGFLVLKVEERYEAGIQPIEKVENEIMGELYQQQIGPRLRDYLETLRRDSYVQVKPGYVDTAGVTSSPIREVQPKAEQSDEPEKGRRLFWLFGPRLKKKSG